MEYIKIMKGFYYYKLDISEKFGNLTNHGIPLYQKIQITRANAPMYRTRQ